MKMDKPEIKIKVLEELTKENWDSQLVETLVSNLNASDKRKKILAIISDELPKISARVCNIELHRMTNGDRKREVILAVQFVYKELRDVHKWVYQSIADRFNRDDHGSVMSAIRNLNGLLETDVETITLYNQFKEEVSALESLLNLNKYEHKGD